MNFIRNESEQKLRGGYYTPIDLATFLARWVNQIKPKNILEPSCGDGVFFDAFAGLKNSNKTNFVGIELDASEARTTKNKVKKNLPKTTIYSEDFLNWSTEYLTTDKVRFDAVVGNPPFIRYQYLPEEFQEKSEQIFAKFGLSFTKHTNAWVPFIITSMALLRPGGRLAMVVPAEIIHITHAQSLRAYLGKECKRIVIVDPQEIWFDNTLQGAVLLLAEKREHESDKAEGVGIFPVKGRDFLTLDPADIFATPNPINGRTVKGKWTYALLDQSTRNLIDQLAKNDNVHLFKDIADVDVGIVTGANHFFLISDDEVKKYNLGKWAYPMFGRSDHCPGIIYDKNQHKANRKAGKPTNFIWFKDSSVEKDSFARAYIKHGEDQDLHTRYKCSVRDPWYSVPSVHKTEVGMLKRSHNTPRLIFNEIGAFTTDTAYRIRTHKIPSKKLVASFMNSLTALYCELEGRHYGGGVLELTPSEIERLLIPIPNKVKIDLKELDKKVRILPTEKLLEQQDRSILGGIGLSVQKQNQLLESWHKLRSRRQRIDETELTNLSQ